MTRAKREAHTSWQSPYAPHPTCEHDGRCVEVTETVPNPYPNDPYYLHMYAREWACEACGAPVDPHCYRDYMRVSNQEAREAAESLHVEGAR